MVAPAGTTATAEPVIVDLRPMMPSQRHATVFAALDSLEPGGTFVLVNDHAPIPLLVRIAERWPDRFAVTFLRNGPEVWQVALSARPGDGVGGRSRRFGAMQLERIENGFQIDPEALGPLLGVPAEDVQRLMREGRIATVCEEGQGEDAGRHRITFRHGAIRVRLTLDDSGEVLLRTLLAVAPRPPAADRADAGIPGDVIANPRSAQMKAEHA